MSAASAVMAGRAAAEARMSSTVTVRRKTGQTAQDETGGEEVPAWTAVYTGLPFRYVGGATHTVTIGGVEFQEATGRGDMPWDTDDLADSDLIDITAGEWAGTVLRIVEAVKGDQRTARRVPVAETSRPAEWA